MGVMPDTRALLGVDVIASASNPGYHLDRLWGALDAMLGEALESVGITADDVVRYESGGDGALYVLPSVRLGSVVDFSERLDKLAERHNRWSKPDVRPRVAVDLGAVGDDAGYYWPMIRLNRLLGADVFKTLVKRCIDENADDMGNSPVHSGLIMSGDAFRAVFGGDYAKLIRQTDFIELEVTNKELTERARVRVPGVDARTLAEFAAVAAEAPATVANEPVTGQTTHVTNHISGHVGHAIQTGSITGGVHIGGM